MPGGSFFLISTLRTREIRLQHLVSTIDINSYRLHINVDRVKWSSLFNPSIMFQVQIMNNNKNYCFEMLKLIKFIILSKKQKQKWKQKRKGKQSFPLSLSFHKYLYGFRHFKFVLITVHNFYYFDTSKPGELNW